MGLVEPDMAVLGRVENESIMSPTEMRVARLERPVEFRGEDCDCDCDCWASARPMMSLALSLMSVMRDEMTLPPLVRRRSSGSWIERGRPPWGAFWVMAVRTVRICGGEVIGVGGVGGGHSSWTKVCADQGAEMRGGRDGVTDTTRQR